MRAMRPAAIASAAGLLGAGAVLMARSLRGRAPRIEKAFTIERSAAELYEAWRDPHRLATILPVLSRVEIVETEEERRVVWRFGGRPAMEGSVTFTPAPGDRGTEVRVAIARSGLFAGRASAARIERDLRRYKANVEAGDIALNGTDVCS